VRVDAIGERLLVGTQLNLADMSRRRRYAYVNRVTLKSNLAAVMLREAGLLSPPVVRRPLRPFRRPV
jgi:hypothetical protein